MLNKNQLLEEFNRQGYVVVERLFDPEDLQPLVNDYTDLLDSMANDWYAAGKIPSAFSDLPFDQRLAVLLGETDEEFYRHFDITLPHGPITEETPMHLSPTVFDLFAIAGHILIQPKVVNEKWGGGKIYY